MYLRENPVENTIVVVHDTSTQKVLLQLYSCVGEGSHKEAEDARQEG